MAYSFYDLIQHIAVLDPKLYEALKQLNDSMSTQIGLKSLQTGQVICGAVAFYNTSVINVAITSVNRQKSIVFINLVDTSGDAINILRSTVMTCGARLTSATNLELTFHNNSNNNISSPSATVNWQVIEYQ